MDTHDGTRNAVDGVETETTQQLPETPMPPTAVSDLPFADRLKAAESRIARLEEESRGFWGWVKKWGAFAGLIVGLVGIPKAALDSWTSFWDRPKTSVILTYPITLRFDKDTRELSLSFPFSLRNDGPKDDIINSSWAVLTPPTGRAIDLPNVDVIEKHLLLSSSFTVSKNGSKDLECRVHANIDEGQVPSASGVWKLSITFSNAENDKFGDTFQFFMSQGYVRRLMTDGQVPPLGRGMPAQYQ
jgi:hypothetical protein